MEENNTPVTLTAEELGIDPADPLAEAMVGARMLELKDLYRVLYAGGTKSRQKIWVRS